MSLLANICLELWCLPTKVQQSLILCCVSHHLRLCVPPQGDTTLSKWVYDVFQLLLDAHALSVILLLQTSLISQHYICLHATQIICMTSVLHWTGPSHAESIRLDTCRLPTGIQVCIYMSFTGGTANVLHRLYLMSCKPQQWSFMFCTQQVVANQWRMHPHRHKVHMFCKTHVVHQCMVRRHKCYSPSDASCHEHCLFGPMPCMKTHAVLCCSFSEHNTSL